MKICEVCEEYNAQIRDLYTMSNETMKVSKTLTERVLLSDLSKPSEYYSKPGRYMFLLLDNDKLIGMVGIVEYHQSEKGNELAEIQRLVIHPDFRQQRLGYKLMFEVHNKVPELGYKNYTLSTINSNKIAVMFYQTLGFMEFWKTTQHYSRADKKPYKLIHFIGIRT